MPPGFPLRRSALQRIALLPLCSLLSGCAVSLRPLERNTSNFAAAVVTATQNSANAYMEANRLHNEEQVALAVLNYDTQPAWNPAAYAKPLLSPAQLAARTTVLSALQQYATAVASLGARGKDAPLTAASTSVAEGLQSLSGSVATSFATTLPNAPSLSDSQTATLGGALGRLAEVLRNHEVGRHLPGILASHDADISAICAVLVSDVDTLRSQADRDYTTLQEAQDRFIRNPQSHLSAAEKRAEIARLPEMVRAQQQNDALLSELQELLRSLAATHHVLAQSAGKVGLDPAVAAHIQQLAAQAQTLRVFASSSAVLPTTNGLR